VTVKQYRTRAVVSSALATQGDESTTAELSTLALDAANITGLTASVAELNILDGVTATAAEINKVDGLASGAGLVVAQEVTFTETVTAGVWTGSVTVPAGATLLDIIVHAVALWDSETSATMDVGDADDPNGFYASVDLKATDLLAGESLSFGYTGGKEGADLDGGDAAGDHVRRRYLATERVISGVITKVGDTGSAGRTRMTVVYVLPTASAATKA
jgi:hypothetical protein